ncbi:MAG TPA: hypothetical protein VHE35_37355 [Kofleriaceae bacterium]|nr:hypothetical protein [Kofleriaceae bacterium]
MLRLAALAALLLVAACGHDAAAPDDAPADASADAPVDAPPDAAIDAPADAPPDAAVVSCVGSPVISVRVQYRDGFDRTLPQPDVRAIFLYPDHSTVVAVTDADGRVAAPGVDGTTVFLSGVATGEARIHVFTRVPACATIELRPPPWYQITSGTALGDASFRFAAPPVWLNGVYGPCGLSAVSSTAVATRTILDVPTCEYEHDATLLAYARDNVDITGWTTLTHVDLTAIAGQTVIVPPLDPPVRATAHWSNAEPGWSHTDTIFFDGPGLHWTGATQTASVRPTTPDFDHVWGVAPLGPATMISWSAEDAPVPPTEQHIVERVQPAPALVGTIDVADAIGTLTHTAAGLGPAGGFSVTWSWGGNASHHGDLAMALVHDRGNQGRDVRVYGPGDGDHLLVPGWPAELGPPPSAPDQLEIEELYAFDLDGDATYADGLATGQLGRDYHQAYVAPEFPGVSYWRSTKLPRFP